jgi:hypothetical protein
LLQDSLPHQSISLIQLQKVLLPTYLLSFEDGEKLKPQTNIIVRIGNFDHDLVPQITIVFSTLFDLNTVEMLGIVNLISKMEATGEQLDF